MPWINYVVGYWLIIYSILKAGICILDLTPPQYIPFKIPLLTHDTTTAGLVLVITFLVFSIYTFFHALGILHFLSPQLINFFTHHGTSYAVYMVLAIILTVFYSLVLFTNLPISKDPEHKSSYEIIGLCGGILFFCTILVLEAYRTIINKKHMVFLIILLPCIFIFILTIIVIIYNATYKKKKVGEKDDTTYNIISAMLIPLATIN